MDRVLDALAPVFLLILLGWAVRASRIVSPEAFGQVNRFGYFILYPAFLFTTTAGADFAHADALPYLGGVLAGFLGIVAIALGCRLLVRDGPAFTSVFQGAARWNGFAILAAANEIFGAQGRGFIALSFGPSVLMLNMISVAVLARWGRHGTTSWRFILGQIAGNPLVIACALGLVAVAVGLGDLGPASSALKLLGQAAMPVALLCVGSGIDLHAARTRAGSVALASGLKLLVAPAVFYLSARLCGASPLAAAIAVGVGSTPTAAASYTLSREMGGDSEAMAAIVSVTTLLSFVTMPVAIWLALQH